jgi:hypothetical protein
MMANAAKGKDTQGYRADFVKLVENARMLSKKGHEEDLGAR